MITLDEYYGWIFENSVPGLPEAAAKEDLTPLQYMRRYGVFKVDDVAYSKAHEQSLEASALRGTSTNDATGVISKDGTPIAVVIDGMPRVGFNTPSRKLEFYSPTLAEWGWPEHAIPRYVPGQVYWRDLNRAANEFDLLPNFRLPTLIHTRSPVKWLYEISHNNPLWIATEDAARLGLAAGDLVKVKTAIGSFVTRAWVTEGIRPGVVGMSHHLGRWRLNEDQGGARAASSLVRIVPDGEGRYKMRQIHGTQAVHEQRPGQRPRLVERDRRASEPDVPGAARSGERHALLAPARDARKGRSRRSLRRHRRRHQRVASHLPGVDGEDASGAWARWHAAADVVRPAAQADGRRIQDRHEQ